MFPALEPVLHRYRPLRKDSSFLFSSRFRSRERIRCVGIAVFFLDSDATPTGHRCGQDRSDAAARDGDRILVHQCRLERHRRAVKNNEDARVVLSDLKETVDLAGGVSRFSGLEFGVPGADARLHDTYNIMNHRINLYGDMKVETKISKTSSGAKAVLLKIMDPLFREKKKGEVVPVRILGTYEKPEFGLDLAKCRQRRKDKVTNARFAQTNPELTASQGVVNGKSAPGAAQIFQLICFSGVVIVLATCELACGGSSVHPPPALANQPTFSHVFLVVEENHSYSEVIGSGSTPYLNNLASQYGLATQYFANAHPSMPNYLMLTTGMMESFDDNFSGTISDDNIVRELVKAGKSWRAYEESIPSAGYLGSDAPPYVRRHNPFSFLSDVQNSASQAANIVPFSQFSSDLANKTLPQFSFIAPDVNNDAHNGTLAAADSWLQSNIAPLLASSSFRNTGLLIITFDESETDDVDHGGGRVATIIVSSTSKPSYQSQTLYQHQSTLRLVLAASGVNSFPGMAGTAPEMTEFFGGQ